MRGRTIAKSTVLLGILALAGANAGCVRYYAGVGYQSSWSGVSRPNTQGYAATPPVVVAASASSTASMSVTASAQTTTTTVVSADAWSAEDGWAHGGATGGIGGDASAQVIEVSAPVSGSLVASLGGLIGAGAPASGGGVARLDALLPLGDAQLEGGVELYADANVRVRASLAHDALPASGGQSSVVVSLEGLAPPAQIAPLRVHLVIDASTSMEGAWQDVLQAADAVVRRLRPVDELQIVVYGTGATEELAPLAVGDGARARAVIRGLRYGGRTNIEAGLRLAYGATRPAGRSLVVVISDGVPQGGLSGALELGALAREAQHRDGAVTFAIGLGTEFHTGILAALSEQGGGELRLAPRSSELSALLERELVARGAIVASGLRGQIVPGAGVVLGGDANLGLGALVAGQTQRFVVPFQTSHVGPVLEVQLTLFDAYGRPHGLEASLSLSQAAAPVAVGATLAVLDQSLAAALRVAGGLVEAGDGEAAAAALRAHVSEAQLALAARADASLAQRNEAVLRIAGELPGLTASASWGARREAGASFVARAFVVGR